MTSDQKQAIYCIAHALAGYGHNPDQDPVALLSEAVSRLREDFPAIMQEVSESLFCEKYDI